MCTYNGERFVTDQLQSLASQTLTPSELVVADDGSSDRTLDEVRKFAKQAPFPVRILEGAERLGSSRNFERAILACQGSLVALADQDDVWYPRKLQVQVERLEDNPRLGAVFSNADIVNQDLCRTGKLNVGASDLGQWRVQTPFACLLRYNLAQGATLVFRTELRPLVCPIPREWVHDAWIALLISAVSAVALLPEPLMAYRQHAQNQLGRSSLNPLRLRSKLGHAGAHAQRQHVKFAQALARLSHDARVSKANVDELASKVEHLRRRAALPQTVARRAGWVLKELLAGGYSRFGRGLWSAGRDLIG